MIGIYCIKVDNCIVYVGKSNDIEGRVRQHWKAIYNKDNKENKYQLLRDCGGRSHPITFWLLEQCEENKLNEAEKFWIKFIKPCLNSKDNNNVGSNITANEFYDYVFNQSDYVVGMEQIHLEKREYQIDEEYIEKMRLVVERYNQRRAAARLKKTRRKKV